MGVIYKIQHKESGKIYIGQTRRTLEERLKEHLKNKHHYHIGNALNKYGSDSFDISVVETIDDGLLNEREKYWIEFYDCVNPKGYNNTYGGEGGVLSEEAKRKISNSLIGHKISDKSRRKLSEAKKGKRPHNNTIEKAAEANYKPIICVETNIYYLSVKEASEQTGIHRPNISNVLTGRRNMAGGYHWRYATEQEILLHKKGA